MIPIPVSCAEPPQADALQVEDLKEAYKLSVPISRLIMTIPKGGLVPKKVSLGAGATASPRYFYFQDDVLHLVISGWFESAQGYPGIDKFWEREAKALEQRGFKPLDVSVSKVGGWDVISYDQSVVGKFTNSHIRAEWVQSGTWIDLHISITPHDPSAERRAKLSQFIKTVRVTEKN